MRRPLTASVTGPEVMNVGGKFRVYAGLSANDAVEGGEAGKMPLSACFIRSPSGFAFLSPLLPLCRACFPPASIRLPCLNFLADSPDKNADDDLMRRPPKVTNSLL
ncbi:unnamed protein product [Gemmata massiliana]|uniref:Uncharacterized protein n=1 Tax=Gemmata massiliana TaxID=1210884 RepID=A0A6P2DLK2_9BACT|nr:unnamed protein product [Gemmata massiliana]